MAVKHPNNKEGLKRMQEARRKKKEEESHQFDVELLDEIDSNEVFENEDDITQAEKVKRIADEENDSEEAQLIAAESKFKQLETMYGKNNPWMMNAIGTRALQTAMTMLSTKTGIYARLPIFCKGPKCPYKESCSFDRQGIAPIGQACPVEIAYIQRAYANYAKEFDLDDEDASFTDINLVDEIITMEVMMKRCEGLMAREQSPVQMTVCGVSEDGSVIETPNVSKAVEASQKFSKKRNEDYKLLAATRSDKKKNNEDTKEKGIMEILQEAETAEGFYDVEERPDFIEGVD